VVLIGVIAVASAFMNNTPLVAVMIPVVMQLAMKMGTAPSKLLIPLSLSDGAGGDDHADRHLDQPSGGRGGGEPQGLEHFGLFEIAPLGSGLWWRAGSSWRCSANRLLPVRQSMGVLLSDRRKMKFFTEVAVPEDSRLIGQRGDGGRHVQARRRAGDRRAAGRCVLRRDLAPVTCWRPGDRVVLRTEMTELLGLQGRKDVHLVDKLSSVKTETVEVLIGPGCRMEGNGWATCACGGAMGSMCWRCTGGTRTSGGSWMI
jgi:hypothetical protein